MTRSTVSARRSGDPEFDAIVARVEGRARAVEHVRILGAIHLGLSILVLGVAAIAFLAIAPWGLLSGDAGAALVLGGIGTLVAGFLTALAVPGLALGIGLLRHRSWSRPLGFVLGVLELVNVPLGTILGAYTLYVLLQEPVRALLEGDLLD